MSPERRWILFLLVSLLLIQLFTLVYFKPDPSGERVVEGEGPAVGQTTGTVTSGGDLRASAPDGGDAQAAALAAARVAFEGTSITMMQHPGAITTATTERFLVGLDEVGAVINSWRILDTGNRHLKKTITEEGGIELVRRLPLPGGQQPWPLEITFKEANARSYEELNRVPWTVQRTGDDDGTGDEVVRMSSPSVRGLRVDKIFSFAADEYLTNLRVVVHNDSETTVAIYDDTNRGLTLRLGPGLVDGLEPEVAKADSWYDMAVYRNQSGVRSMRPKADQPPLETEGTIFWAGVESKFFAALILTNQGEDHSRLSRWYFRSLIPSAHRLPLDGYIAPITAELSTERFDLAPGGSRAFDLALYVGPKKYGVLKAYGNGLQDLAFHEAWAFTRAIYLFLTDVLNFIYGLVANYGIAIIILTILVRLLLFPLTQKTIKIQAKSMAEMSRVKPHIDAISEKYKDDPQEKSKQIWKVYQEHNISPFAALRGCFPMLLQMPVFIGLYRVCNDTIDLHRATFLWIRDLSQPDHLFSWGFHIPFVGSYFNLLPILMAVTQLIASKVAMARMTTIDPTQKQIMYMMPVMLAVMLYKGPSGLMLYWVTSNIWQIGQTMVTNRILEAEELKHKQSGGAPVPAPAPVAAAPPAPQGGKKRKRR